MDGILPIDVVGNFSIMSLALFPIMVGIGMSCQGIEPEEEVYFQMGKITGTFFILMAYGMILAVIKVEESRLRN